MIRIVLPLPSKWVARNHEPRTQRGFILLAREIKKHRRTAYLLALEAQGILKRKWKRATVRTTFYFRDRRTMTDDDNAMYSAKHYYDGIADAGVVEDDEGMQRERVVRLIDKQNPRVEIEIEETKEPK